LKTGEETAQVLAGWQGHFSETDVNPFRLPLSCPIRRIMQ
jgi:hypothetical protein